MNKYIFLFLLITPFTVCGQTVSFQDQNLDYAIRVNLKKGTSGTINRQELESLVNVNLSAYGIVNLAGIENCTNLEFVDLSLNEIGDVSILNSITTIKYLDIGSNNLISINGLFSLRNCVISLERNSIASAPNIHNSNIITGFNDQKSSAPLGNFNFTIRHEILDANLKKVRIHYRSGSDINQNAILNVGDTRLNSDPLDYGLYNIISDGQLRYIDHTFRKTGSITMFMYFQNGGSQSKRIDKTFTLNNAVITLKSSAQNFNLVGNSVNSTVISLLTGAAFTGNARIVGANASSFSLNTTNVSLNGTGTQSIGVTFNSSGSGTKIATLEIYNTSGVALSIPITGTVQVNDACLSPSVSTIQIQTGNTNAPRQFFFELANTSAGRSVTVNNIQFTGSDAQYFSYDPGLFSTPRTINPSVSTGFLVRIIGSLSQNRNYNANITFNTNNPLCPSVSIPITAVNQNSAVSWVEPKDGYTVEYINGIATFVLKWQGYVQGANSIDRAVQSQYSIENGPWTHISQSSQDCTKGHDNNNINIDYFALTDANAVGKKVQFRIKPCNTDVPWQYSGFCNVISSGYKPIEVAYPNGKEVFNSGEKRTIRWNDYVGYKNVDLYYSTNNLNSFNLIAQNVPAAAGAYEWTVPNGNFGLACYIKVVANNVEDKSDYPFTIQTAPVPVTLSNVSISPEGCNASPAGSMSFKINGGSPPFRACFLDPEVNQVNCASTFLGQSQNVFLQNLRSRNYKVQIEDANNKLQEFELFVPQQANYGYFVSIEDDICSGNKGKMSVLISGDFPDPPQMTLKKNNTQIYQGGSTVVNNLGTGTYQVSISGTDGCLYTEEFNVSSSPGTFFPITPAITNTSCSGITGAISLNVSSAQNASYQWSNGATTQNISAIAAGQYTVKVTDATGCVQNEKFEVFEEGGVTVSKIGTLQANSSLNNFGLFDNQLYFSENYTNSTGYPRLGILNMLNNNFESIQFQSLHFPTRIGVAPNQIEVTASNIYVNLREDRPDGRTETHFLKIDKISKQIQSRIIILFPLTGTYQHLRMTFANNKLYALRDDSKIDIINFSNNSSSTVNLTSSFNNFIKDNSSDKIYLTGSNGVAEFNLSTNTTTRTTSTQVVGNMINQIGSDLYIVGEIGGDPNTYVEKINLNTFLSVQKYILKNKKYFGVGRTAVKSGRYLYVPANANRLILIFDVTNNQVEELITNAQTTDLVYLSSIDKLVYNAPENGLYQIVNNKFDFITSSTNATCSQNNGTATLNSPNDGKTYSYLWQDGNTSQNRTGLGAGLYEVTIQQTGGCAIKKNFTITQQGGSATAGIVTPAFQDFCQDATPGQNVNLPVPFSINGNVGNIQRWEYKTPSGNWINWNQAGQTYTSTCCFGGIVGTWKVRAVVRDVSNTCPEVITNESEVRVKPNPVANFTYTQSGSVITFTNTSTGGETYNWNFGDNTTSGVFSPIQTYASNGTFTAKLRTINACGTFNEISKIITISCVPTAILTGTQTINAGQSANLSVALTGSAPWSVVVNGTTYDNIVASPKVITVSPTATTTYTLSSVNNGCGAGTVSGNAVVTVNQGVCPGQPDLIISDIQVTKYTSDRIYYRVSVKNIGSETASLGSFNFATYGSAGGVKDVNSVQKNVMFLGGGSLGKDQTINYDVWASMNYQGNEYYYLVQADHYGLISECDKTNNWASKLVKPCNYFGNSTLSGLVGPGLVATNGIFTIPNGVFIANNTVIIGSSLLVNPVVQANQNNITMQIGNCLNPPAGATNAQNTTTANVPELTPVFTFVDSQNKEAIYFNLTESTNLTISIWDQEAQAKLKDVATNQSYPAGDKTLELSTQNLVKGKTYIIHFATPTGQWAKVVAW